ncbi:hypothetical protein [Pontibacter ruber]|uniref:DUF3592 domain-containing protein n=1 Tax=Pontibacter ruber TaxID=1343895 RepID=A0ABW5CUA1_9BACT|nr:hypothetical protein [Pontibacter ruber]
MSQIRRQRREARRSLNRKPKRFIDWTKVLKLFKSTIVVWICFYALICGFLYYSVTSNNNKRNEVFSNVGETTGLVVDKATGRGAHYATYTFKVNDKKFTGSSFHTFRGQVGDEICILYNRKNPESNIYCEEKEVQNFNEHVLMPSLMYLGLIIAFSIISIPVAMLLGNKKLIAEVTSIKK